MDTYCARSWNYFLVDLDKMEHKMCCKTKWEPLELDADWFNGDVIKARRQDHLNGIQTPACFHCWDLENRNQWSPRLGVTRPNPITDSLESYAGGMLEIEVGNTCDMACRYCDSRYSSIWAARMGDVHNSKETRAEHRQLPRSRALMDKFYAWLEREKDKLNDVLIQGGEPLLIPETYDIIERVDWRNVNMQFNTNLNTPEHYMVKIEQAIDRLTDQGNKVYFRVSVDGVGEQNSWQRQNCDWNRWRDNWYRIGSRNVIMKAALTVTALTMESMPGIAQFVLDSAQHLHNQPRFEQLNVVTWPRPLDVTEWLGSFQDELQQFDLILDQQADYGNKANIKKQVADMRANQPVPPSVSKVRQFVDYLDDSQTRWGGGDWRAIYPKTAAIAQRVLEQTQP